MRPICFWIIMIDICVCLSGCTIIEDRKGEEESSRYEQVSGPDEEAINQMAIDDIQKLVDEKDYPRAIFELSKYQNNPDALKLEKKLRNMIGGDFFAVSDGILAMITDNGKICVKTIYSDDDLGEIIDTEALCQWENVSKVYSFQYGGFTGIDEDGRILTIPYLNKENTTNYNAYMDYTERFANKYSEIEQMYSVGKNVAFVDKRGIAGWLGDMLPSCTDEEFLRDCTKACIIHPYNVFLLKRDGTVSCCGDNLGWYKGLDEWTEVVDITVSPYGEIYGLMSDGTIKRQDHGLGDRFNLSDWTDIIAISYAPNHFIGLKKDGSVRVAEIRSDINIFIKDIETIVANWKDIVAVKATNRGVVGIKEDGEVLFTEYDMGNLGM